MIYGPRNEECYVEEGLLKVKFPNKEEVEFAINDDVRERIFDRQVVIQNSKSIGFYHKGAVTIMEGDKMAVFNYAEFLTLFPKN